MTSKKQQARAYFH